jgi:hypothetical protein
LSAVPAFDYDIAIDNGDGTSTPCDVYDVFTVDSKTYTLFAPVGTDDGRVAGFDDNGQLYMLTDPDERDLVIAELEARAASADEELDLFVEEIEA